MAVAVLGTTSRTWEEFTNHQVAYDIARDEQCKRRASTYALFLLFDAAALLFLCAFQVACCTVQIQLIPAAQASRATCAECSSNTTLLQQIVIM
jgi:hypothetical protein